MLAHLQLLFPSGLFPSSLLTKFLKVFFKFIVTAETLYAKLQCGLMGYNAVLQSGGWAPKFAAVFGQCVSP